jgi:hypothetical protein
MQCSYIAKPYLQASRCNIALPAAAPDAAQHLIPAFRSILQLLLLLLVRAWLLHVLDSYPPGLANARTGTARINSSSSSSSRWLTSRAATQQCQAHLQPSPEATLPAPVGQVLQQQRGTPTAMLALPHLKGIQHCRQLLPDQQPGIEAKHRLAILCHIYDAAAGAVNGDEQALLVVAAAVLDGTRDLQERNKRQQQ